MKQVNLGTLAEIAGRAVQKRGNKEYEVVVGNIGSVYAGPNEAEAERTFAVYKAQSESGVGRAGGESVVLFADGEIVTEIEGRNEENNV